MRVVETSSRYAYLFVVVNLVLLLAFLMVSPGALRRIESTRDRFDGLVRSWLMVRLESGNGADWDLLIRRYEEELLVALALPVIVSASRIDPLLASTTEQVHRLLRSPGTTPDEFQAALLESRRAVGSLVEAQRRALEVLLVCLAATIVVSVGILVYVERQNTRERIEAANTRALAQATIDAHEEERLRISRGLHDGLAQELSLAVMEIDQFVTRPDGEAPDRVRERLRAAVDWVRHLAHDLRPAEIDQVGLSGALAVYCDELTSWGSTAVTFACDGPTDDLLRDRAMNVYRIAQEALTNVVRHSRASSARVTLSGSADGVELTVRDDGTGFRVDADRQGGVGVFGMRELAAMLGARLEIRSSSGHGTTVRLSAPRGGTEEDR